MDCLIRSDAVHIAAAAASAPSNLSISEHYIAKRGIDERLVLIGRPHRNTALVFSTPFRATFIATRSARSWANSANLTGSGYIRSRRRTT